MNSKLRILSALLAFIMIFSVALVGCSDDKDKDGDTSKTLHVPTPKPIEKVTLKALQASVPENSPVSAHNLDFQLPETLDTDYDQEAYFNYRVEYNLLDQKMQTAALDKVIKEKLYKDCSRVWYKHTGDQVFQISENSWGLIVTVSVNATSKDGEVFKEMITFVLTGLEE